MTTMFPAEVTCALCGETSTHDVMMSTNTFGSPDLDLRPAPMQRHTMSMWLQRCPGCGLCAHRLGTVEDPGAVRAIVDSPAYQAKIGEGSGLPELARTFVGAAHLAGERDGPWAAGQHMREAAWVCDDAGDRPGAVRCRSRAVELIEAARADGREPPADPPTVLALLTDLARRAGRFPLAARYAEEGAALGPEAPLDAIFRFQQRLVAAEDDACYTIEAALAAKPEPGA